MYQVIIVIHVLLGLGVIGLVLIQQGKGADAGAAFGSASSGSVFGAQGASSFLSRSTAVLATLFFSTSLGLAILIGYQEAEVDLMDTPQIEEVIADVPLVNDAVSKIVPKLSNETPEILLDDAPAVIDSVSEGIQTVIETTEQTGQDINENINQQLETDTEN